MNDRKQQVLLIAQQIFVEKGFSATSVQDILDKAHISKGTFYNYFSSKNECLMAILERGRDETRIRRRELLIGQDISNKRVLIDQISTRQQVNRDHNLLPIFETVFHSGDPELRDFAKKHHLTELSWLTGRLADVYGEEAVPYAPDCAVLMMGMMQHMMQVGIARSKEDIDTTRLVAFVMRRIDAIMSDVIKTTDRLLEVDVFQTHDHHDENAQMKQQLLEQLTQFYATLKDESSPSGKQYVEFIMEDLHTTHPRIFLLNTVIRSFSEAFIATPHELAANELASNLSTYLESLEKRD